MGDSNSPATVQLRPGAPEDLDALTELELAAFSGDRLSRRQLRHHLRSPRSTLIVAVGANQLFGYALLLTRTGSQRGRLYSIAVSELARGMTLGARLLAAIEAAAVAAGLTTMQLEVRTDNDAAIKLYLRSGYVRYAQRPGYYEDGGEAVCMEKGLGPRA